MEAQEKFEIEIATSDDATRAVLTVGGEVDVGSAHEIDAVVAAIDPMTLHTNGLWPWSSSHGWKWSEIATEPIPTSAAI